MKVTLEFEQQDLREMLTEYFRANGFAIKNLDHICEQFTTAFPSGLAVQAEIVPNTPDVTKSVVDELVRSEGFYEPPTLTEVEDENPILTADELFDSTPRKSKVDRIPVKEDSKIASLLKQSKDIENSRRK